MIEHAPGAPGIPPSWTSSAKDMVGCALGSLRLWFTLGFGIVNEVYYPRMDIPQIRDLGLIVADGEGFWAEVKRVADYQLRLLAPGVPAVEIVHRHQRYSLLLRIAPGSRPRRPYRMAGGESLQGASGGGGALGEEDLGFTRR
jgi:glucoamylase